MIQIAPQVRILVAVEAIDGRKSIDAIAQLCREKLNADPFSGYLFIFRTHSGPARNAHSRVSMMSSAWPERIVFGHAKRRSKMAGKRPRKTQNRVGFSARHGHRRKCLVPASTPAFPHTTSRLYSCRTVPCGSMPPGGPGRSRCSSVRLAPGGQREAREKLLEAA